MLAPVQDTSGELRLVCVKCTRERTYTAASVREAAQKAKDAGWIMDRESFVCPRCPAVRA